MEKKEKIQFIYKWLLRASSKWIDVVFDFINNLDLDGVDPKQ